MTAQERFRGQGRLSRLGFRFSVIGVVLGLIGPVLDAVGAVTDHSIFVAFGIVVQAANVAFILGGVIAGSITLAQGARPRTPPVLAILGLPISGLLILIEAFIIFVVTT